jgi:hypothetical protein
MPHNHNTDPSPELTLFNSYLNVYESAKTMLTNGQTGQAVGTLGKLYDTLRKQAPMRDSTLELRVRLLQMDVVKTLKSITFGMVGFDSWDA